VELSLLTAVVIVDAATGNLSVELELVFAVLVTAAIELSSVIRSVLLVLPLITGDVRALSVVFVISVLSAGLLKLKDVIGVIVIVSEVVSSFVVKLVM